MGHRSPLEALRGLKRVLTSLDLPSVEVLTVPVEAKCGLLAGQPLCLLYERGLETTVLLTI